MRGARVSYNDFLPSMSAPTPEKGCAVVTGSSQGLGHAIAKQLARDGFSVVINDLPEKEEAIHKVVGEITAAGGRALGVVADVAVEADVKNMIQRAVKELGPLAVVNLLHHYLSDVGLI
jgi:NAD(P)-dependent dehydrogenase (short-subunit alcohol dehydrogenase family)